MSVKKDLTKLCRKGLRLLADHVQEKVPERVPEMIETYRELSGAIWDHNKKDLPIRSEGLFA